MNAERIEMAEFLRDLLIQAAERRPEAPAGEYMGRLTRRTHQLGETTAAIYERVRVELKAFR